MNKILLTVMACVLPFVVIAEPAPSEWESAASLVKAHFASLAKDASSVVVLEERRTPPTGDPQQHVAVGKIAPDGSIRDLEESKGRPVADEVELTRAAKETVGHLVRLAAEARSGELEVFLVAPDPAEKNRHSTTPESLISYFRGVDFQKLEYATIGKGKDGLTIFVRLRAPRHLDLDFILVSREPLVMRLRSAHP